MDNKIFEGLPQEIIDWIKTESKKAIPPLDKKDYNEAGEGYQIEQSWVEDFRGEWIKGAVAMYKHKG